MVSAPADERLSLRVPTGSRAPRTRSSRVRAQGKPRHMRSAWPRVGWRRAGRENASGPCVRLDGVVAYAEVHPASIGMIAPLMCFASSEARKSARSAISVGFSIAGMPGPPDRSPVVLDGERLQFGHQFRDVISRGRQLAHAGERRLGLGGEVPPFHREELRLPARVRPGSAGGGAGGRPTDQDLLGGAPARLLRTPDPKPLQQSRGRDTTGIPPAVGVVAALQRLERHDARWVSGIDGLRQHPTRQ